MTRPVILLLAVFLLPGLATARGYEARKTTGEYSAELRINRNPPVLGDNHIEIEIKDAAGKSVTDARVLVNYYMPPMPRMAPMNYRTDAQLKKASYRATMNLIMSGPWVIAIIITRDGKTKTAKFNVDAQ